MFYSPAINSFRVSDFFSNGLVLAEKFEAKVEIIYSCLLPRYQGNNTVLFPLTVTEEFLMSLRETDDEITCGSKYMDYIY